MLEDAASKFDIIIIDSAPVLGLADSPVLSAITDGVLLVFGADYHQINIPLLGKNYHLGPRLAVNAPWVVSFGIAVVLALIVLVLGAFQS